jgi:hypothetical protein
MSVLGCKAILILGTILHESKDENVLAVTAWTLGQIGKHSPEHAKAVASANLFPRLVQLYTNEESGEDLKFKCKLALKLCLQKCLLTSALEPLLYDAPPEHTEVCSRTVQQGRSLCGFGSGEMGRMRGKYFCVCV